MSWIELSDTRTYHDDKVADTMLYVIMSLLGRYGRSDLALLVRLLPVES
jgi:hypothetical protein